MYPRFRVLQESLHLGVTQSQLHDTVHVLVFLASPFCKLQLTANCLNLTHDYCILHTPGHCMAPGGFEMRMLQGIFLQRYVYVGLYRCTPFLCSWHCFPPLFCSAGISNSRPSNTYIWETQLHVLTITVYYICLCVCVYVCILWNPALAIKFDRGVAPVIRKSVNLLRPHVRPKLMYFLLLRLYQPNWSTRRLSS